MTHIVFEKTYADYEIIYSRFVGDVANLLGATLARLVPTVIVRTFLCHSCLRKKPIFQVAIYGPAVVALLHFPYPSQKLPSDLIRFIGEMLTLKCVTGSRPIFLCC